MVNKKRVQEELLKELDHKINLLQESVNSLKESRNNNSKSSAGDKHETGRAMAQIELDNQEMQLARTLKLKADLTSIETENTHQKIGFGSLVTTDQLNYFIAIPFGKIKIDNDTIYGISIQSPIGKLLNHKSIKENILFNGKTIDILSIE